MLSEDFRASDWLRALASICLRWECLNKNFAAQASYVSRRDLSMR